MENSTKALLLAASVLIVIVLISVGIKILGSTKDVTNQVDSVSGTMASSIFNSQFSSYFDNHTSGTQARALVSKIISNNAAANTSSFSLDKHQILVNLYVKSGTSPTHKWKTSELQSLSEKISRTSNYKIGITTGCGYSGCAGGYHNGYIACISITEL